MQVRCKRLIAYVTHGYDSYIFSSLELRNVRFQRPFLQYTTKKIWVTPMPFESFIFFAFCFNMDFKLKFTGKINKKVTLLIDFKTTLTLRPEAETHIGDALIEQSEKCHFRGINLPKSTSAAVGRFKRHIVHKLHDLARPPKRAFFWRKRNHRIGNMCFCRRAALKLIF